MPDLVVLLTPFIVLVVLLLFGFTGCSIIYDPDNLPDAPNELFMLVRVPAALTVQEIRFRWTDPNNVTTESTQADPAGTLEGDNNVFSHLLAMNPLAGAWDMRCRVTAQEPGSGNAQDQGLGNPILEDASGRHTGEFQASGTPSGGDFVVTFVGLTAG